ncbi:leucyl aminopeptidase family protein [Canibacter zhoujuaniae]|uniref:leucyl aminopeptidase family protein n=1 Tax=Canibacter zhoujuaniae TaxID=2708343 RepID=UPI001421728A|nr:leucyl aminopeptidase [Canibacter zhoujuaniae]
MNVIIDAEFNPVPSLQQIAKVQLAKTAPNAAAVAVFVKSEGALPDALDLTREQLELAGFAGKKSDALLLPGETVKVLVGIGKGFKTAAEIRNAVACFTRNAAKFSELAVELDALTLDGVPAREAAQAAAEGALLARYAYEPLKNKQNLVALETLTLIGENSEAAAGAERGTILATADRLARDLGNTPPRHLNAYKFAEVAERVGPEYGLEVEVFGREEIIEMGLGGLLGVNAGSVQDPRLIKVSYRPEGATEHIGLVGKGIMYDSGGISLKPSNASHCSMKMDMMGAAAVFSAMTALKELGVKTRVTGFLMCTDNMPSGSATKLGDVLTMRNGKTVEVRNTDAEGRLVLGDGIALAAELEVDAIVDVATLTGAAMMALGTQTAAVFANNDTVAQQLQDAGKKSDETLWRLPLDLRLKKAMKSNVADFANIGANEGGAITAALFLNEFVAGTPWGHIDIAGPMESNSDDLWRSAGSTGYATRLLAEFAADFKKPSGDTVGTELE